MRGYRGTPEARFWQKVDRTGDCWLWTGATTRGYAYFYRARGCTTVASHFAWLLGSGEEVPADRIVLHRCDNPLCVRFDHLFIGTFADNTADMISKGRMISPYQSRTHCKRGHELTAENTHQYGKAKRACRECAKLATHRYLSRKRSRRSLR
jgi:hypothetical protein